MFAGIVEDGFIPENEENVWGAFRRGIYLKVTADMLRKTGI